jgi:protein tyrosine/serine phosphatase
VHCLDGRRIVGLVVLLLRRLQGWATVNAFAEYWR